MSHEDAKLQSAIVLNSLHRVFLHTADKTSFYPTTITDWNKLPRDIALSNPLAAFKNAISNIDINSFITLRS